MTRLAVLVLVAGCGRVAFDARTDAATDAAGFDARICVANDPNDEDGDGLSDTCDPCPHEPSGLAEDTDNDGVGDACDPEIENPRQRIRFFDGFNADLPEWDTNDPVVGGQRVVDVMNAESGSVLMFGGERFLYAAGGAITAVGPSPQQMFMSADVPAGASYYVELINEMLGRRRSLMHYDGMLYDELDGLTESATPITATPFFMGIDLRGDEMRARISVDGSTANLASATPAFASFRQLFYVKNLSVVIDYVIVIETF